MKKKKHYTLRDIRRAWSEACLPAGGATELTDALVDEALSHGAAPDMSPLTTFAEGGKARGEGRAMRRMAIAASVAMPLVVAAALIALLGQKSAEPQRQPAEPQYAMLSADAPAAVAAPMRRVQPSPRPAAKPMASAKPAVAPSTEATLVAEGPAAPAAPAEATLRPWLYDEEAKLLQYGEMVCSNSGLDGHCDEVVIMNLFASVISHTS